MTTGVAIVGVSVIAVTPITAPPPDAQIHTHALQLSASVQNLETQSPFTALVESNALAATDGCSVPSRCDGAPSFVNPIQRWAEVFERASFNLGELTEDTVAAQGALLQQIFANQTSYVNVIVGGIQRTANDLLRWATEDDPFAVSLPEALVAIREALSQGDVNAAASAINDVIGGLQIALFGMAPMLAIPYQISRNVTATLETFAFRSMFEAGLVARVVQGIASGLVATTVRAIGETGQALVDAVDDGDPLKAVSAIVNFPADMTYAFLNGVYSPPRPLPIPIPNPPMVPEGWTAGILTDNFFNPLRTLLVAIPQAIAAAIAPSAAVATATGTGLASVALDGDVTALPTADTDLDTLEGPTSPGAVNDLTSGATDAVNNITNAVTSAIRALTVTLPITQKPEEAETVTADATSTEGGAAGTDTESSTTNGDAGTDTAVPDDVSTSPGDSDVEETTPRNARAKLAKTVSEPVSSTVSKVRTELKSRLDTAKADQEKRASGATARDRISSTVNKVRDTIKSGLSKPGKKDSESKSSDSTSGKGSSDSGGSDSDKD